MQFTDLGLSQPLLDALADQGYTRPTPIQMQAIPAVNEGRDLLAAAQTGTGKTAGFTLPILNRLSAVDHDGKLPRALILTPTRELAAQVGESVRTYGAGLSLRSTVIFGGVGAQPQIKALRKGVDIVIATPGRLLDLIQQGELSLKDLEVFVLDEADRMLDMGFIHDIRRILKLLPAVRQNLLFSATFSDEIEKLAHRFLTNPLSINVAPRNATADRVEQQMVFVPRTQKRALVSWLIGSRNWQQVLVFTRTKHGANRLAKQLTTDGLTAEAIHGNKSQNARTKALAAFKSGQLRVLVATDIAARGIDIDRLPHVINFEIPNVPEDYVHRIGRTGRAGECGEAVSLVDAEERKQWRAIERLIARQVPELDISGFSAPKPEPDEPRPPKPPAGGRGGNGRSGSGRAGSGKAAAPDQAKRRRRRRPRTPAS